MTKIVYNACYGGFSISKEAILRGRQLSNDPKWGAVLPGERYPDGSICDHDWGPFARDIARHDPILVQVVEELGAAANGSCAHLKIADVPTGSKYRIDEYDGFESVETPDSYEWSVA